MRNLLKRQPSTEPKPNLRERLCAMKAKAVGLGSSADKGRRAMLAGALATTLPLPALAAPASTSGEYAEHRSRLLTAYAEERAARPILNIAGFNSIEEEAGGLVLRRCSDLCAEILALPAPQTRDGLGLMAMAAALIWEASEAYDSQDQAALAMTRAMLAVTGVTMPPSFTGFAGDPGFREREDALFAVPSSLPAWAIAEAEAGDEEDDEDIRARIEATWGDAPASDAPAENVVPQPKPEVLASPPPVEAKLMALVAEYEGFARVSDEAVVREDEVGFPRSRAFENALDRTRRFTNQGREDTVRHAMALPATTLLGFGLKGQILEHDAGAAWGENEDDIDIVRCRAFLHALIAAAGLSPIRNLEVTSDEVRGWLANPSTAPGASRREPDRWVIS